MHGMTTTLDSFIAEHGIKSHAVQVDRNPNMADNDWARTASHWNVTLTGTHGSHGELMVPYSMGSAHTQPPTTADVLDRLGRVDGNGRGRLA
jgi:hypothetical protein